MTETILDAGAMTVWRIVKEKHAKAAFTGEGARLYGGRWNSPGTSVIYAAQSQSLAILETLVHLDSPELLKKYVLFGIDVDTALISRLEIAHLPKNWKDNPIPVETQTIGDGWVESHSSAVLSVPSAVVPAESNFLLNPAHPEFARLKIRRPVAFQFDPRFDMKRR